MPKRYESRAVDPSPLAQPLHFPFSNRTARNRILKGAMSENLATWHPTELSDRGIPTPELINVYRRWGEGEVGVLITGNVQPDFDQLEGPGNAIIPPNAPFSGPRFEAFKKMAEEGKKHGSLMIAQMSHPGRQVGERINEDPVSASDVRLETEFFGQRFAKPHPASEEEIDKIVEGFAFAAEYLDKAGFDGIELHGAHGYLLAQFLSLKTNRRTDDYGVTIENRVRIITRIAASIHQRVSPSFILGIKLNSVEFQGKDFSAAEAREVVCILEENRFDFVELSGGTYEHFGLKHERDSTRKREAFFIEWAELIVPALKQTKAYVTGGFKTVAGMVDALKVVDGVGLGRPLCSEPCLVRDMLAGKVSGAIKPAIDEDDYMMGLMISASQIRQMGKDLKPFDPSDKKTLEKFQGDLGKLMEEKMKDEKMEMYGAADVSFEAVPYVA